MVLVLNGTEVSQEIRFFRTPINEETIFYIPCIEHVPGTMQYAVLSHRQTEPQYIDKTSDAKDL